MKTKYSAGIADDLPSNKHVLNDFEAAAYLSVSPSTLRKGRMVGKLDNKFESPPFVRFGRNVRYLVRDLDDWLMRHRVVNTLGRSA